MSNTTTLLHIDNSVRGEESVSVQLTHYLIEALSERADSAQVIAHDLGNEPLPQVSAEMLRTIHGSLEPKDEATRQQMALSDSLIEELMQADAIVIGAPMYNFGVPATLKAWIDHVCRARITFRYTENGPEGLTGIENGYIVVASGGTPIGSDYDFVSGYIQHVLRFIGVKNIHVIRADGSATQGGDVVALGKAQIDDLLKADQG